MARRRLNRRVVIILVIIGTLLIAGMGLGYYMLRHKDPGKFEQAGDKALEAGQLEDARDNYGLAYKFSDKNSPEGLDRLYKYADVTLKMANEKEDLTVSQRDELRRDGLTALRQILTADPARQRERKALLNVLWPEDSPQPISYKMYLEEAPKLLEQNPDLPEIQHRLAIVTALQATRDKSYDKQALEEYKRAIELKTDDYEVYADLARHHFRMGRYPEALAIYNRTLEKMPRSAGLRIRYASLLSGLLGTSQDIYAPSQLSQMVREQYDKAAELSPEDYQVLMALGTYHLRQGRLDRARELYGQAIEARSTAANPWIQLSQVAKRNGQIQQRRRRYEKVIEILNEGLGKLEQQLDSGELNIPQQERVQRSMRDLRLQLAEAWSYLALESQGREEAVARTRQLIDTLEQEDVPIERGLSAAIPARLALVESDLPEATRLFETAYEAARNAGRIEQIFQYGRRLFGLHLAQQAPLKAREILLFLKGSGRLGRTLGIRLLEARYELATGDITQAETIARSVLQVAPDNPQAQAILRQVTEGGKNVVAQAETLWQQGQRSQAIDVLEAAFEKDPTQRLILLALDRMYQQSGQPQKRIALVDKALQAAPDNQRLKALRKLLEEPDPEKRLAMQLQVLEQNEGDEPDDTLAVLIQKYRLYQRYGKDDKAEEIFQQLASRHGETSSVMQLALQRAAAKREWDAAMEWAQKAREAASETRLGQVAPANVRRTQAKAILSGGDVTEEDRDKAYELLLKAASEFETAQRQGVMAKLCFASAADCYLMLAQLRPEQRDAYLQQADEAAGRALEYDADYMPAIEVKLSLAQLRNDTLARDRWLEQAHRINPMNPQIRLRWINLQEKTADRDEILRRRQLLDADTDGAFPSNTLRLAQLYEQTGQADKATETYRRYFNEAPSKIQGFIALGRYLVRSGNAAQAQELYANLLRAASEEDKLRVRLAYADVMRPSDPAFADRIVQQILDSDEYKNEPRLRSLRVQRLAQQGRYDQAITLLRRMLEDNDTPQQRRLLISWLIQARKYDQAIDEIEAMDTESPEAKAWALLRRAGIAQARAATMTGDEAMSELAKAKNLINQAIDANPDDATPLLELARYEQRHGQMFRAIEAAERARQLSDSPGVLQILADLCRQDHQYARAETLYRALLNAQGSRQAYEQLLNYYDSRRNWAKYDQLMAEAVQVFPRSDGLMLAHARSYNRRAHAALRAQRSQQAQQYLQRMSARLEQVLQLSPDNVQAWRLLLSGMLTAGRYEQLLERFEQDIAPRRNLRQELLAYKAAAQGALGREDQAMETFAEAIRNAPVSSLSSAAALVERTLSPREEALSRLRDWVALRENDPHWLAIVAGKHMAGPGADMDYARQLYQRALGRIESGDPLSGEIHGQLGMIWYRNKDYQKAEKAYLRAIESGSVSAGLLNNLAYMYAEDMNQPEKALPYARRAAQIAGQNPSILDTYAWALVRSGHLRDARQPMEQAIQAADNPAPLLRYHMGFVYEKLKQYAQAQRQYRLALEDARIEDDASLKQKATEGMHRIEELTQSPNGES